MTWDNFSVLYRVPGYVFNGNTGTSVWLRYGTRFHCNTISIFTLGSGAFDKLNWKMIHCKIEVCWFVNTFFLRQEWNCIF